MNKNQLQKLTVMSFTSLWLLVFFTSQKAFGMEEKDSLKNTRTFIQKTKENSKPEVMFETQKVIISQTAPFLEHIKNAEGFLYGGAFKLQNSEFNLNPRVAKAFKSASQDAKLQNKISLILEGNLTPEEQKSDFSNLNSTHDRQSYETLGIKLCKGSFPNTHFKILVSEKYGIVGTTNFDKEFEEGNNITRDFSLILREPPLIEELKGVFESDIGFSSSNLKDYDAGKLVFGETRLSWGPIHHRQHFYSLIKRATTSIEIYQQALQDPPLTSCLCEAIKKGVKVSILMSQFPFGSKHGNKSEAEQRKILLTPAINDEKKGEVRLTGQTILEGPLKGKMLNIHAKVMIVDGAKEQNRSMYLGSVNFFPPALDEHRNVGIITRNSEYIIPVWKQFLEDWEAHKGYGLNIQ